MMKYRKLTSILLLSLLVNPILISVQAVENSSSKSSSTVETVNAEAVNRVMQPGVVSEVSGESSESSSSVLESQPGSGTVSESTDSSAEQVSDSQSQESSSETANADSSMLEESSSTESEENSSSETQSSNAIESNENTNVDEVDTTIEKESSSTINNQNSDTESQFSSTLEENEKSTKTETKNKIQQANPTLRNAVLLSAPVDPTLEGWSISNVSVRSSVILNDQYEMRFLFGPNNMVGSSISGSFSGTIPNFYLYNRSTGAINGTLWPNENVSSTSHGTIVAELDSPTSNSTSFNRYTNIEPSSVTMYRKSVNNSQAIKIRFTEQTPNTSTPILFEIELFPLISGNVRVTHRAFNTSTRTLNNMVFGTIYDAYLGTDTVPVRYIGNNKGLYTQSNSLHLDYIFLGANKNDAPLGLNWAAAALGYPQLTNAFPNFSSPGRENSNDPAGSYALQNRDSAIYMKTMPTSFAPGDSLSYTYDVGVMAVSNTPDITVNKTEDAYTRATTNLEFEGTWRDFSAQSVELFYQIDGKAAVKIGQTITNSEPGVTKNWKVTIPASQFESSTKNIKFFVRNNTGNQSSDATVKVTYQTQSTITQEVLSTSNSAVTDLTRSTSYNVRVNYKTNNDLVGKSIGSLTLKSVLTGPVGSVSDISLVKQNGTVIGTGTYDATTKTVAASVANGSTFSSNDTVSLRYTLVTAAQAPSQSTIKFVGSSNVTTTTTSEIIASATNTIERTYRDEPPSITSRQADVGYLSTVQSLSFDGTWIDPIGSSATLYYQIDNGTPVAFQTGAENTTPGQPNSWQVRVPTSSFMYRTARITFYLVNNEGVKSNERTVRAGFNTSSTLTHSIKTLENVNADTIRASESYLIEMSYQPNQIISNRTIAALTLRSTITGPDASVSNITMVNQNGVAVGTGTYNATTRIVEGTLNAGTTISTADKIFLRFTLTVSDQATEGEVLRIDFRGNPTRTTTDESIGASTGFLERTVRNGSLDFTSAPATVDYGVNPVSVTNTEFWPTYSEPVTITDTRQNGSAWRLKLAETSALSNGTISLAGDHFYSDGTTSTALSTADIIVAEGGNEGVALEVTADWNESTQKGLFLDVPIQKQSTTASFEGTLRWTLEDVPGN